MILNSLGRDMAFFALTKKKEVKRNDDIDVRKGKKLKKFIAADLYYCRE
jgi:hypothetical protein